MNVRTISLSVAALRDSVFHFLADIENLPKWAAEYCERLELRQGRWWAYTSLGEMLVELETCGETGVVDLRAGPAPDRLGLFPFRVLPLGEGGTLVSFTLLQPPGMAGELYEEHYRAILGIMRGLARRFGGGELYAPEAAPQLAELGLN
jgi:hypothetical protein